MVGVPVLKRLRQWPIGVLAPPPMRYFNSLPWAHSIDWAKDAQQEETKSFKILSDNMIFRESLVLHFDVEVEHAWQNIINL